MPRRSFTAAAGARFAFAVDGVSTDEHGRCDPSRAVGVPTTLSGVRLNDGVVRWWFDDCSLSRYSFGFGFESCVLLVLRVASFQLHRTERQEAVYVF